MNPGLTQGLLRAAYLAHGIAAALAALVLWGWAPGGSRTVPPMTHEAFVNAWKTWASSGAACP